MLGYLVSIMVFGFVAVIATRICTSKDWPLAVGLAIGIGGQILSRFVMSIVTVVMIVMIANDSPVGWLGWLILLLPMLGVMFPLVLAWMLPVHRDPRQEWLDSHPQCSRCGAPTALSTPVCEKCTT